MLEKNGVQPRNTILRQPLKINRTAVPLLIHMLDLVLSTIYKACRLTYCPLPLTDVTPKSSNAQISTVVCVVVVFPTSLSSEALPAFS